MVLRRDQQTSAMIAWFSKLILPLIVFRLFTATPTKAFFQSSPARPHLLKSYDHVSFQQVKKLYNDNNSIPKHHMVIASIQVLVTYYYHGYVTLPDTLEGFRI